MTCNNSGIVQTSFHIASGLFVGVTPDRKRVQIIKTNGPSPYEGGKVLFSQEFPSEVFISAFLATSRTGNTDDWWVLLAHWRGELDMFKPERDAILRAITRMPKVDDPVIGAVYRNRQKSRVIATVTDNPGSKDCVHMGNGAYGMLVNTGNSDGSGAQLRCDYCAYAAHTVTLQCRHEWVTVAFFPHNMEQRYRCRLCGQSMATGGCALDDPRRGDPAERLDATNTTPPAQQQRSPHHERPEYYDNRQVPARVGEECRVEDSR